MRIHFPLFVAAAVIGANGVANANEKPDDFGILQWIHKYDGGYFSPKQEFRYEISGDTSSPAGIFAKKKIEAGEVLATIPWDLIVKSDDPSEEGQMCCGTVRSVARLMQEGENSEGFAPVVSRK